MKAVKQQSTKYKPQDFERKWQMRWEEEGLYQAPDDDPRPKFFQLDFFPYPSGDGLSVGHSKHYIPTDVYSRYLRMTGLNVMHPMGWDAFGLPAENEAIVKQMPPAENTARNIANYKRQLHLQGISFDWSREINSCQPDYYRWTQWFFLLMLRRGLAYRARGLQWWCPQCKTILANEQVENGYCWRHTDQLVEKKEMEQWYFRITEYAEQLLQDLNELDWPERIILMQRNWIGKSTGADIVFEAVDPKGDAHPIEVFTTRPDTVFGATFLVLAPEHPLVETLMHVDHRDHVTQYQHEAARRSEIERLSTEREKTGVDTGALATNPFTGEKIPIWIADYVLFTYGTGAIMAVPAHDQRDFVFARTYDLPIVQVIQAPPEATAVDDAYEAEGTMINSGDFTGLSSEDGKQAIIARLEELAIGKSTVTYRMRDWLVSRQRYWGAPIPIVYCPTCGIVPVPEVDLPVLLPYLEKYEPGDDGRSPLANSPEFVNTTCPSCGGPARRETDTLDTFVDSSWYYLRYTSPHDDTRAFDPEKALIWCPLDLYVGGAEHAVMHLLYFRFFTKAIADAGLVEFREPAPRLMNQGVMHAPDGRRMSKSRRNVITPDSVVEEYGADTLRGYICFIGPFESDAIWDPRGINGVHRWLSRIWDMAHASVDIRPENDKKGIELRRAVHKTVKKVGRDMRAFQFNTAVSALMELTNTLQHLRPDLEGSQTWNWGIERLLLCLSPIAPHLADELWYRRGHRESIHRESWPDYDDALTLDDTVTIVIQVNGKVRERIESARGTDMEIVRARALSSPRVKQHVADREVLRVVTIPDKLINIVIR